MEHCKDVSVRKGPGAITRAFGHINEWDLAYVERFRSPDCLFVGKAETTICALIMHEKNGAIGPTYRQWLHWQEGESIHLQFEWITDTFVDSTKCDPPRWFYEGQEVVPRDLAISRNFEAARSVRMTCAGMPGLATLALRSHLLARAFQIRNFLTNDPTLWVPRGDLEDDASLAENFLRYVCTGSGPLGSPAYHQMKHLTKEHYQVSPWHMYHNAGCMAEVMMSDFGRTKNLMGKLIAVIRQFREKPLEMSGISDRDYRFWLSGKDRKRLRDCVPWWFIKDENYTVPELKDCFISARRVDTVMADTRSFIPSQQMGFGLESYEDIRRKMHRAGASKQQPPAITEVKPEVAVVDNQSEEAGLEVQPS